MTRRESLIGKVDQVKCVLLEKCEKNEESIRDIMEWTVPATKKQIITSVICSTGGGALSSYLTDNLFTTTTVTITGYLAPIVIPKVIQLISNKKNNETK